MCQKEQGLLRVRREVRDFMVGGPEQVAASTQYALTV